MVHWDRIDFKKIDEAELDVGLYWVGVEARLTYDKFSFIHYFTDKEEAKEFVERNRESAFHIIGIGVASFNEYGMLCPYITDETALNGFYLNEIRYSVVRRYTWCDIYYDHVYYFNSLHAKRRFELKFNSKPSTIRFLRKGGFVKIKHNTLYPRGW